MTTGAGESLERRVLDFIGAFAQLQSGIDFALECYLKAQMPTLGVLIARKHLRRLKDDERLDYLVALSRDTGYSIPMPLGRRVFERAKQTRDLVGHGGSVRLAWNPSTRDWRVAISHHRDAKRDKVPAELVPETFDRLANDVKWLGSHVTRLVYDARLSEFIDFSGEPVIPPAPLEYPQDGEPLP